MKLITQYITISNIEYDYFFKINDTYLEELDKSICSCEWPKCTLCSNNSIKYIDSNYNNKMNNIYYYNNKDRNMTLSNENRMKNLTYKNNIMKNNINYEYYPY